MIKIGDIVFTWHWSGGKNGEQYDVAYAKVLRVNKKTYSLINRWGVKGRAEKHLIGIVSKDELDDIPEIVEKLKKS